MYKHLLVPADGSPAGERGLREAIALAADQHAQLTVLTVIDEFPLGLEMATVVNLQEVLTELRRAGQDLLDQAAEAARAAGVQADTLLRDVMKRSVADIILEEAAGRGCDLIVMGTHGRRGLRRLTLGSDAELVVRLATVPVLLVRQDAPRP